MTDGLKSLLDQQQTLDDGTDCQTAGFAIMAGWQALQVTGDDAENFLQSLLTNDIKAAKTGVAQLNGFCQAKGRLLATFWLLRRQGDFVLIVPADQAAFLAQRLNMFKLRSKVDIAPLADYQLLALPDHDIQSVESIIIDDRLAMALVKSSDIATVVTALEEAGLPQQSAHCWHQRYIQAGYPMIYAASRERFTAQQVNLDLVNGVNFRKGCYPGQEVVARLHYLGEAKRRLFIAEANALDLPEPGCDIKTTDGEVAGQLVQASPVGAERCLLQLTLKLSMAEQTLFLAENIEINNVRPLAAD